MESPSLLPCNQIKLEPDSDSDCVYTCTEEMPAEVLHKMIDKIPTSIKVEQQEDPDIQPSSENGSSFSTQEHTQVEMQDNPDLEAIKQEVSDQSSWNRRQIFSNLVDRESGDTIQEMKGHCDTEPTVTGSSHRVPLKYNKHGELSKNSSSVIGINIKLSSMNETCQFQSMEASVKHKLVPANSHDCIAGYKCGPQKVQMEVSACVSGVCNPHVNVDRYLNIDKRPYTRKKFVKCGASVTEPDSKKIHKIKHTSERPYKCDECGTSFIQFSNLKCHKRIHTGEKPYTCDDCGASFIEAGKLNCHKRRHTGEKPYKCDDCGASFSESGNLKYHKRTHTGEKPYKCDVCEISFTQAGSLKRHKRTHTGEKPFICDDCGSSFNLAGNLKRHKRTHTGEKPYECDICGASFTEARKMRSHKERHTGEKAYKFDSSKTSFSFSRFLKNKRKHTDQTSNI